tara:strand:+ start:18995 stop:19156 length:162 start_codon:yes stop_codon:yes gene_type:complete
MDYERWELWFIQLGVQASLSGISLNVRDTSVWQLDFEEGLTPSQSISKTISEG